MLPFCHGANLFWKKAAPITFLIEGHTQPLSGLVSFLSTNCSEETLKTSAGFELVSFDADR